MFFKKKNIQSRNSRVNPGERSKNYNYYNKQTDIATQRDARKSESDKKEQGGNRFFAALALILFVVLSGYILYLSTGINLNVDKSSGSDLLRPNSVYSKSASVYLSHSIANISKITVNNTGLENYMENNFPELNRVSVTVPLIGHELTLNISQSVPVALVAAFDNKVYLVKSNGVVICDASSTEMSNYTSKIPYIISPYIDIQVNHQILSMQDLSFIAYTYKELNAHSIKTVTYTLVPNSRELDVKLAADSYLVKFNLENSSKEQVGSYLALKKYLNTNKINPAQYIDVRVIGRAYYK
jgi:hypothetical protein